jgi:hypothetical protein
MPIHLLAEPEAIAFLRFWAERRGAAKLPEWDGRLEEFPPELLPSIAITERRPDSVFRHVGADLVRRWSGLEAGVKVYEEAIRGEHGRYLHSLGNDVMTWRGPVFSAACYRFHPDEEAFIVVRIYAPFATPGSGEPRFIAGLQIVPERQRAVVDLRHSVLEQELDRRFIADTGTVIARIEASQHDVAGMSATVRDLDRALGALSGSALVMLTPDSFPVRRPPSEEAPPA